MIYTLGEKNPPAGNTLRPSTARYYFQVANFRDPQSKRGLRLLDGRDEPVKKFVGADPRVKLIRDEVLSLAYTHIRGEKEAFFSLALEDRHGKWIAPAIGEIVADALDDAGFKVVVVHRGLNS